MAKNIRQDNKNNVKNNNSGRQYFNLDDDKAIFEEVDEELRNEKFKQLINKYGGVILSVLVLALTITIGYERIEAWKVSKAEKNNIQYVKATAPMTNYEDNIIELENIVHTSSGMYKDISQLQIANLLLENNQTEKGLKVLVKIHQDVQVSEKIREIAAIKLATYKIDTSSYEDVKSLLEPIINRGGAWAPMAKELLAMSAIYNKNLDEAKKIYNDLLTNDISDEFKSRVNDMLASINEAQ